MVTHLSKQRSSQMRRRAYADTETEVEESEAICSILDVRVDNVADPKYTRLTIEVRNYPGLLRTVAWTINGLGVRAQNAKLKTDEEGFASMSFCLCDLKGRKLSDDQAQLVRDSLQNFVQTCMPATTKPQTVWQYGNIHVSNLSHPEYTELVIKGEPQKAGFLLEIATVMSAIGATVHEMTIQGDADYTACCKTAEGHDFKNEGRVFRFLLSDSTCSAQKLNPGRVGSVLYTLDLVAGNGHQPTSLADTPH